MNTAAPKELLDFPVNLRIPIAWGEMDALGHVNNIMYFRYFESVRCEYFERIGFWSHMQEHGIGPILGSTECKFKSALSYPDSVIAATRIVETGLDRFKMEYVVYSEGQKTVVALGSGLIVSYDYRENKKCPIPADILSKIEQLESAKPKRQRS